MATHLIRKLEQFTTLSGEDKRALERAASLKVRHCEGKEDIIREGDTPRHVNLILQGWACRYKLLEDGRRSITAFLVPGDLCDMRMFILKEMDHTVGAVTQLILAEIPTDAVQELADMSPRIGRALWWNSLVEEAIAREWITSAGHRDAVAQIAHLCCELFIRLKGVGLVRGSSIDWPLTQAQMGEATGMSTVHVNRTVQELRDRGLVVLKGKTLTIPDLEALKSVAMFNPNYLHLDKDGQSLVANEA